jgi:hypothetical protein
MVIIIYETKDGARPRVNFIGCIRVVKGDNNMIKISQFLQSLKIQNRLISKKYL